MSVVALDVGGTGMKGATVSRDGTVLRTERRPTGREHGPAAVLSSIVDFAADLADGAGAAAAGLAVPGIVDGPNGIAVYSANIGWRDAPLRDLVAERLGIPVALDHDVRTGGIAEGLFGAGRGVSDFLFLPIGTGIAGAVVIGGRPYAGASAAGGEIGHVAAFPDGEPCACGQRGCLETYASAASIARRYGDLSLSTEDVIARAQGGNPKAEQVWNDAVTALAIALAGYTLLLDPALVVLGGGLAEAGETLLQPLREQVAARLAFRPAPPLVRARLGSSATMLGAAVLAWRAAGVPDAGESWSTEGGG